MLVLLSPAKSLDYDSPLPPGLPHSLPGFVQESARLVEVLRTLSPQQIASLMDVSDALATLNAARYAAWSPQFTQANARQALFAFNGDVYEGLDAGSLSMDDVLWAQDRLVILSGLYGALRPLDWMQPYRLEMGTRLETDRGANLYAFWGPEIARYLNDRLRALGDDAAAVADDGAVAQVPSSPSGQAVVVNLASQEYFKAVQRPHLQARVVECVFEDYKSGAWKVVSFHAKRARGLMARHIIRQRLTRPHQLTTFAAEGYAYAPEASAADRLVFRRSGAAAGG